MSVQKPETFQTTATLGGNFCIELQDGNAKRIADIPSLVE